MRFFPFLSWSFFLCSIVLLFPSMNILIFGSPTAMNETDKLSLLAFKNQITNDPLRVMNSWNDSLHFCDWHGITCGRRYQRVTRLDLRSESLAGPISPFIGNLTFLRRLDLVDNNFNGEIPQQITHLFRLRKLLLGNNSLTGEIPANLSHCSNLTHIYLSFNLLVGKIPVDLGLLMKLVFLDSENNNFIGGIPHSFGNLSALEVLGLPANRLEGSIPDSLGRLTRLQYLFLGRNKLSGMVPFSMYNLSNIIVLALELNQIYGFLPPDMGFTLPNLEELHISENQFCGPIPVSIGNASKLAQFVIIGNNFTGKISCDFGSLQGLTRLGLSSNYLGTGEEDDLNFLTSLTNSSNLENLYLDYNYFGGSLPNSIANLSSQLLQFSVEANQIFGKLPVGIGNLVSLNSLWLDYNLFTGSIPSTIGKLQNLNELSLVENRFSGKIPSSMGNLTKLIKLYLGQNHFSDTIPSTLGNCKSLLILDLYQNNLRGTIPHQVLSLSSLALYLSLAQNFLSGPLPLEVASLINLATLDISENKLSGEIPYGLGQCRSLLFLYMDGNTFQGSIPSSLTTLNAIEELDLSRNNFSGKIPKFLCNFKFLGYLNLSSNDLEGEVPVDGRLFQNKSAFSIVGNNKLCGGIPELQLPHCPVNEPYKKQGIPLTIKLIITSCSGVLCLIIAIVFILFYRSRKGRKENQLKSLKKEQVPKISYQELLKATSAFSSANFIGAGSFGSVFKGILDSDDSVVAVKVLNLQVHGAYKSFMAECEALRNIRHRNLVQVITSCSSIDYQGNDFKAIIYEFMPNGSLERWLHPEIDAHSEVRNLNFLQRLNIAIDVAAAVEYLHHHCQTPIVHCDLKPNNILLDTDLIAYVSDFGLARFFIDATKTPQNQTSSLGLKGSIGYTAPEYGMGIDVSTQGDVYSYGILLLEIFTGKRPTNDMFIDGLNLHNFAKMALPDRVMDIIDPSLVHVEEQEEDMRGITVIHNNQRNVSRGNIQKCLISVLRLGVACSMESPRDRINMSDVSKELNLIKDIFLGVGTHGDRR